MLLVLLLGRPLDAYGDICTRLMITKTEPSLLVGSLIFSKKKSFTLNHNIRKSFGSIPDLVDMPNLLEIQRNSYDLFLQKNVKPEETNEEKEIKILNPISSDLDVLRRSIF